MQFSITSLISASLVMAMAAAAPASDVSVLARGEEATAANPTVHLYTDTGCSILAKTVDLGTGGGCITYAGGFASMRLAANPRTDLAAFTFLTSACSGSANNSAVLTSTSKCDNVGTVGVQHSFYHN